MNIREAQRSDVPALSKLARRTYAETFGDGLTLDELSSVLETTRSEKYFSSVIGADTILVAVEGERLVGYVQISGVRYSVEGAAITERDQAIHAMYVASGHQGRGVGRSLMDAAFKHPRIVGAENVYIDVYEKNARALRFYRGYGFREAGTIDVVIDGKKVGCDLVLVKPSR
jgi:ribosomal protein S18 acetylase RimI-like enzyme